MRTILVTGSDTGIGKTHVVAALARLLARRGGGVQIVKVVETGVAAGGEGDAARARRAAGPGVAAETLESFALPLAPVDAAEAAGRGLALESLVEKLQGLPPCDWRICEGAGGIASPIDDRGRDWADFAVAAGVDTVVLVVPDRLGAINQARLAWARAGEAAAPAGVWLNACAPVDRAVGASNRAGLRRAGVPLWAEQAHGAALPEAPESVLAFLNGNGAQAERGTGIPARVLGEHGLEARATTIPTLSGLSAPKSPAARTGLHDRCQAALAERERKGQRRTLAVTSAVPGVLNLADNDYLDLAHDPAVVAAAGAAAVRHGTSASASPLITGWREPHEQLVAALCAWHGFPCGMLWTSGFAANSAVLGTLPREGDLVLADRLIHHSMIAGLRRSPARLLRYAHLDLDELERRLARMVERVVPNALASAESNGALGTTRPTSGSQGTSGLNRCTFVVTESVFSMDGDYPDMARLADLKRRYGFCWVVDEAHALGWYGREGAGLARAAGVEGAVDILVGTLGKALASGGGYTLFRDAAVRDTLVNFAGEFIYSTALPPANAGVAAAALARVRTLAARQPDWHESSRAFRAALRAEGWAAPDGESPIVPVRLDRESAALALAGALRAAGILAASVRPPTVPAGTSRLRFSLKRTFTRADGDRVLEVMRAWREKESSAGVSPAVVDTAGGTPALLL